MNASFLSPRRWTIPLLLAINVFAASRASAQSLFEDDMNQPPVPGSNGALPATPAPPAPATDSNTGSGRNPSGSVAERLTSSSLFAVVPPKPKSFQKHDQIELIINETSVEKIKQSLDTKKDYNFDAALTAFPSLEALLEGQLKNNPASQLPAKVGVNSKDKWKGEGTMERNDNLTTRVSGRVMDVKPNGILVIEARESRQQDEEVYTLVVSGTCRSEDITKNNTLQSGQLADLAIRIDHEGQVKRSSEKGLIPRVFDFLFNF